MWFGVAVLLWLPQGFLQGDVRAEPVTEEVKKLRCVVFVSPLLRPRPKMIVCVGVVSSRRPGKYQ